MEEELKGGIGLALVLATLLALVAILVAEATGIALFGPEETITEQAIKSANESKGTFLAAVLAECLNGKTLVVAGEDFVCRRKK